MEGPWGLICADDMVSSKGVVVVASKELTTVDKGMGKTVQTIAV